MSEQNEDILKAVRKNSTDTKREITSLTKELDKLKQKEEELVATGKTSGAAYETLTSKIRATEAALVKNREQLDHNNAALKLNKGTLQQNQAMLTTLTSQYDRVAKAKGADSEAAKNLNVLIGTLNNTIADQEKKLEKSREVFDAHKQSTEYLGTSLNTLKGQAGEFGPGFASVLEGAAGGFNAMKRGLIVYK